MVIFLQQPLNFDMCLYIFKCFESQDNTQNTYKTPVKGLLRKGQATEKRKRALFLSVSPAPAMMLTGDHFVLCSITASLPLYTSLLPTNYCTGPAQFLQKYSTKGVVSSCKEWSVISVTLLLSSRYFHNLFPSFLLQTYVSPPDFSSCKFNFCLIHMDK